MRDVIQQYIYLRDIEKHSHESAMEVVSDYYLKEDVKLLGEFYDYVFGLGVEHIFSAYSFVH